MHWSYIETYKNGKCTFQTGTLIITTKDICLLSNITLINLWLFLLNNSLKAYMVHQYNIFQI